jgi:hypothetical protein
MHCTCNVPLQECCDLLDHSCLPLRAVGIYPSIYLSLHRSIHLSLLYIGGATKKAIRSCHLRHEPMFPKYIDRRRTDVGGDIYSCDMYARCCLVLSSHPSFPPVIS